MTAAPVVAISCSDDERSQKESHDLKTLAYGGSILLVASAFGNGLNYAFGVFLARTLGSEDFGLYALALTIFNMVSLTVVFGLDIGATKFVSHYLAGERIDKARETLTVAAVIGFISGLVSAVGVALLAQPIAVKIYGKPELAPSLLFFAVAIPFSTVTAILLSSLQAHQTVRYTILVKYLWEPIAKFLLAGAALWLGFHLLGVLGAIVVTLAASFILACHAAHQRAFVGTGKYSVWSGREARILLAYSSPLAFSNLFGVVAPRSDMLLLGYWESPQDAGVYLAAFQTAAIMALVLSAFDASLGPIISRAWSQQDKKRMKDGFQTVSRLSMTAALPMFCSLLIFSNDILEMFGAEFVRGGEALMVLAFGQVFNTSTGSANTILLMSGHSRLVMMNTIVMGIALLVATVTLIPFWGITGAAGAAAAIFILTNVVRVSQVWRLHHIQPYTWLLVKPVVAAIVSTVVVYMLHQSIPSLPAPVLVCALGLLYLGLTWRLGIGEQDRDVVAGVVSQGRNLFARG